MRYCGGHGMISRVQEAENHGSRTRLLQARTLKSNTARDLRLVAFAAILFLIVAIPSVAQDGNKDRHAKEPKEKARSVLWSNPTDITSRDLFYGPGGKSHEPRSTFTFLKEDLNGTNPKFDVRDENGI